MFVKVIRKYFEKNRELILRCGAHTVRIIIEDILLIVNGIIQFLKLLLHGVKVPVHLVRALSRVYVRTIIKPSSEIIRQHTKLLLVITYLFDKSSYVIPDLDSLVVLCHVRDIRDYERLIKIRPGSTIIDVGAHVGFFTVHAYKNCKSKCFCIAYEPHPLNYALLKLNTELNNIDKCIIRPYALSAREGKTKLYIHSTSGWHSIRLQSSRAIIVKTTTLDREINYTMSRVLSNFIASPGERCNIYVKIDVEGAEDEVLEGSTNFIKEYRPYIVLEAYKANIQKILSILTLNSYLVFIVPCSSKQVHIHAIPKSSR